MPWPFAEMLGMRPQSIGEGRARFELEVAARHLNPNGTLHGGVIYSVADTAMGAALFSQLDPGEQCATLEIKMNYLLPVTAGRLDCVSRVLHKNGNVGVIESEVRLGDALAATALGTFSVVRGRG